MVHNTLSLTLVWVKTLSGQGTERCGLLNVKSNVVSPYFTLG